MSFEEEFDKIIRQKAEDAKYPFDEGAWHKVSSMLDGERKVLAGAGIKKAIVPIAALLTIGAVGFFAYTFIGNEETSALPKAELAIQTTIPANEKSTQQVEEKTATTEQQKSVVESNLVKSESKVNSPVAKSISRPLVVEEPSEQAPVTTAKQNESKVESLESTDQPAAQDVNISQEPVPANPGTTEFTLTEDPKDNVINHQDRLEEPMIAPPVANENKTEGNSSKSEISVTQALANEEVVEVEQLKLIFSLMPVSEEQREIKEGYQYPVVKDDDYYNKGKLAKKHYLNVEAGGVYLFGWDQQKGKDGKGFDYFGGLNYGRYITRKFSVSLGLQLYNVSNISKPFYEVSNKEYSFGSTSMYTVVTTNNMLFAAVPLKFNYALNNRNTIALGMNFGYLVAANSYVETYYMRDNEKIYSGTSRGNQIFEGTRSLNMMLTAGYTMHLSNRIAIKGEYLMGLTDLFENTAAITGAEKTSGLRFGIQYTLFDK